MFWEFFLWVCLPICPPSPQKEKITSRAHACSHAVKYSLYRFDLCMISAKLHVFWPASLWHQVIKVCIIKKESFVARWQQMPMSCGKKTILPGSSTNGHDDPQIWGQKINCLICSSSNCAHNWLSENWTLHLLQVLAIWNWIQSVADSLNAFPGKYLPSTSNYLMIKDTFTAMYSPIYR